MLTLLLGIDCDGSFLGVRDLCPVYRHHTWAGRINNEPKLSVKLRKAAEMCDKSLPAHRYERLLPLCRIFSHRFKKTKTQTRHRCVLRIRAFYTPERLLQCVPFLPPYVTFYLFFSRQSCDLQLLPSQQNHTLPLSLSVCVSYLLQTLMIEYLRHIIAAVIHI